MTDRDNSDRIGVQSTTPELKPDQSTPNLNFINPTEFVDLPSEGKFYPIGHYLRDKKDLELKYMTAKEEDLRTSKSLLKKGIAVDRVLESLLVDKKVKLEDLIVGDKNALIIATRKSGYGSDYNATMLCPKCQKKVSFVFNLDEIKNKEISSTPDTLSMSENGTFIVTLPKTKAQVEFRPLTGKDEKILSDLQEQRIKDKKPEAISTTQIKTFVVAINGDTDKVNVSGLIDQMPAFDAKFLRNTYKQLIPDVDMTQKFECSLCEFEEVIEVPLTTDFFWPK